LLPVRLQNSSNFRPFAHVPLTVVLFLNLQGWKKTDFIPQLWAVLDFCRFSGIAGTLYNPQAGPACIKHGTVSGHSESSAKPR